MTEKERMKVMYKKRDIYTDTELDEEMTVGYIPDTGKTGKPGRKRVICPYCGSEKTDKLIFDVCMKQEGTDRVYFYCSRCCKDFFCSVSHAENTDNAVIPAKVWAQ